jgi:pilus assembly protein CpaF
MSAGNLSTDHQIKLKAFLVDEAVKAMAAETNKLKKPKDVIREALTQAYTRTKLQLPEGDINQIFNEVSEGLIGYGPLQPLLDDEEVTEIMVNGPSLVYAERNGRIQKTDVTFIDDQQVIRVIENIIRPLGRSISPEYPAVDARLPDGSRVNAIIPTVAIDGPSITIRKFPKERLGIPDLIRFGSLSQNMAEFLEACVKARLNIIISGGTGSGKTTLLNILSSFIPSDERIVTIEDAAELQLQQEHILRLETKPADAGKDNEMTVRALVRNALRMRPDRRGARSRSVGYAASDEHGPRWLADYGTCQFTAGCSLSSRDPGSDGWA